jgi:hypothetical protein
VSDVLPVSPPALSARKKGRSPAYPAIPLDVAIQRVRAVYERERRHPVPIPVIQEHWGYASNSGPANVTVAALKRYGLLHDEGQGPKRRAWLTELALEIVLSEEPAEFVRKAALAPDIHLELWEKYGGTLPSDATLRRELILSRGFTESGAREFISQFRKTIAFARLDEVGTPPSATSPLPARLAEDREESKEALMAVESDPVSADDRPRAPATGDLPGVVSIPILLPGVRPVHITGAFPITEAAWQQLIRVLEAMKGGLVSDDPDALP